MLPAASSSRVPKPPCPRSGDRQRRISALGGSCERDLLRDRIAEAGPDYRMEIASLTVRGARGRMRVRETGRDGTSTREQSLVREGGRWRLGL